MVTAAGHFAIAQKKVPDGAVLEEEIAIVTSLTQRFPAQERQLVLPDSKSF